MGRGSWHYFGHTPNSMRLVVFILSLLAATLPGATTAFVAPAPQTATTMPAAAMTSSSSRTAVFNVRHDGPEATGWDSFKRATNVPGGEEQRKYRRTVYSHNDWKKHRSQDRFLYYLFATFKSGVYKSMQREVGFVTATAIFVCVYNAIAGGWTDLDGVQHAAISDYITKIGIPMPFFTLTAPSLGLLLVFRTNTSYQRWDEARKNWGMNINHTRNLVRMANAFYDDTGVSPEQRADDMNHVARCTWSFVRCMKRHLSPEEEDEDDFQEELYEKLPAKQAEMIIAAAHRPNRALQDLSYAIDDLPMHFVRKNEVQRAVTIFEDTLGGSERILTSPVPLFYSRHLARFLAVWLLLLPFGIYDSFSSTWNHVGMIPATAIISIMLFGIEEIGTQLEEPFTVLPMQAFCDKIYNWCTEISKWVPGDNGRPMKPVKPEHAYFRENAVNGGFANGAMNGAPSYGGGGISDFPSSPAQQPQYQQYSPGSSSSSSGNPLADFLQNQGRGQ